MACSAIYADPLGRLAASADWPGTSRGNVPRSIRDNSCPVRHVLVGTVQFDAAGNRRRLPTRRGRSLVCFAYDAVPRPVSQIMNCVNGRQLVVQQLKFRRLRALRWTRT